MSSNVTKRTLSAGLGVGALALLAPRASADTPFSSFAFPATGAPTARTLPDRLGGLKNVKDFGARGNGSTDDTAAIQAAVNQGGTIYFPPGNYVLTSTVTIPPTAQIDLIGSRFSEVKGVVDGYFFDCPVWQADQFFHMQVYKLSMVNHSLTPRSGCINITGGIVGVTIEDCYFEAWRPISSDCFGVVVRNCVFRNVDLGTGDYSNAGIKEQASIAIYNSGATGGIYNCDINGYYEGIRCGGYITIEMLRCEMCERGIVIGLGDPLKGSVEVQTTALIDGAQLEANNYQIVLHNSWNSQMRSVNILGDPFSVNTPGANHAGILVEGTTVGLIMQSVYVEGTFQIGGIVFQGDFMTYGVWMGVRASLQAGSAPGWVGMGLVNRNTTTFMQCNNP